jgi:hypothetical protein
LKNRVIAFAAFSSSFSDARGRFPWNAPKWLPYFARTVSGDAKITNVLLRDFMDQPFM